MVSKFLADMFALLMLGGGVFIGYWMRVFTEWWEWRGTDKPIIAPAEPLPPDVPIPIDGVPIGELSKAFGLPTKPELIITKRCPEGYSAKQILGYTSVGRSPTPPSYPGGLRGDDSHPGWIADHA